MNKLLIIPMVLLPCTATAKTDCNIVDYPDHYEAVCTGDAKMPAVSDQTPAAHQALGRPLLSDAAPSPAQSQNPAPGSAAGAPGPVAEPGGTSPAQGAQGATVVHRQGRQQYQKGLEDARAARNQLINELQGKPNP
jgi:hypothetical protein